MRYASFHHFMRDFVLPLKEQNPEWIRLDGETTGSNPSTVAIFEHQGGRWEVHADTRFDPLLVADTAVEEGQDPFVRERSRSGKRDCLCLRPDLRAKTAEPKFKYLFVYEL